VIELRFDILMDVISERLLNILAASVGGVWLRGIIILYGNIQIN
jgi:hypothetical protein